MADSAFYIDCYVVDQDNEEQVREALAAQGMESEVHLGSLPDPFAFQLILHILVSIKINIEVTVDDLVKIFIAFFLIKNKPAQLGLRYKHQHADHTINPGDDPEMLKQQIEPAVSAFLKTAEDEDQDSQTYT